MRSSLTHSGSQFERAPQPNIILGTFFVMAQDVIGFVQGFELFLGCRVPCVQVWVVLASQFTKGRFDRFAIGKQFYF